MIFSKYILNLSSNPSSRYSRYCLCCMRDEADCAMVAVFLPFDFFLIAVIVTSMKSSDLSPVSCMVLVRCIIMLRTFSPIILSRSPCRSSSSPAAYLSVISLITLSTSLFKIEGSFLSSYTSSSVPNLFSRTLNHNVLFF